MKMVKSLLLGAAAGLVAMAGAQAADLSVKAKPVQYAKICSLYGAGFYYIPDARQAYALVDKASFYYMAAYDLKAQTAKVLVVVVGAVTKYDHGTTQAALAFEPKINGFGAAGLLGNYVAVTNPDSAIGVVHFKKEPAVYGSVSVDRAQMAISAYSRNEHLAGFASHTGARVSSDNGVIAT